VPITLDLFGPSVGVAPHQMHRLVVLTQLGQFEAALDGHALRCEVCCQDAFGLGLRGHQGVRKGALDNLDRQSHHLLAAGIHVHAGGLDAGGDKVIDDAHSIEHVQAARVYRDGTGLGGGLVELVDDADGDAAAGEVARCDQSDRPGAHDDDVRVLRGSAHVGLLN
jgi:hypothetical protein